MKAAMLCAVGLGLSVAQGVQAQPTLNVGWTVPGEESKYLMMKRPELFPELGKSYKINWTQFQGTSPMVQAMRAGVLHCATMAPMSLANGYINSGLESYVVAQHVHEEPGYFSVYWAVKDDSPIQSAADLKGKVIGTNAYGSGVYYHMVLWLQQQGIDPEKDVRIVETGFPPAGDAIRSGRIDAGPMAQPFAVMAEKKGGLRKLFSLSEVQAPLVQVVEGCEKNFSDDNTEVVKLYIQDLQRAMQILEADPDLAREVSAAITRGSKELLDEFLFTNHDFARTTTMMPDLASIQKTYDLYVEAGFLKEPIEIANFYRADLYED